MLEIVKGMGVSLKNEKKYSQPSIRQGDSLSAKLIELNLELEEKNKLLEQSEHARKSMFSNITHDLRAPITAILGAVDRVNNKGINDGECLKMLKIIESRAVTLEHLVNDLFFSIQVEQPGFLLDLSCLEIAPVLEEFFISIEGTGRMEDRDSRLEIPYRFSAKALIDPPHFLRVLDNLISNALRHTGTDDMIELGCRENEGLIEIYVTDSGSGILESDLPYIFERTFAGEWARTPGKSGSGLGLSIARTIIEKHGGAIKCHSVFGEGATFTIYLPSVKAGDTAKGPDFL